jgi:uncharacterized protein
MGNPFTLSELAVEEAFCDREKELKELSSHALNKANVVLYSPRRYGKTSLVKRVLENVAKEGVITLYMDFFGVDSVGGLSNRLCLAFISTAISIRKRNGFSPACAPS